MKIKYLIFLVFLLMSVSSCQDVKDGLTGSKKSNSDEFLIQKKNPLVLPPDYSMLPEPKNTINTNNQIVEEDQEIEELSFNAKKRIKLYFSQEKYVNSHFELYESLL